MANGKRDTSAIKPEEVISIIHIYEKLKKKRKKTKQKK